MSVDSEEVDDGVVIGCHSDDDAQRVDAFSETHDTRMMHHILCNIIFHLHVNEKYAT